jgi:pimeloyl-ACP methyl ester carboxylesterase
MLRAGGYAVLKRTFQTEATRWDSFTRQDIEHYVRAAAQPGALTAGINYYRALFRGGSRQSREATRIITAPTLLIWGEQDRYLGPGLTEGLDAWVPQLRVERLPNASHWVQLDAADEVNRLMLDFLGPA